MNLQGSGLMVPLNPIARSLLGSSRIWIQSSTSSLAGKKKQCTKTTTVLKWSAMVCNFASENLNFVHLDLLVLRGKLLPCLGNQSCVETKLLEADNCCPLLVFWCLPAAIEGLWQGKPTSESHQFICQIYISLRFGDAPIHKTPCPTWLLLRTLMHQRPPKGHRLSHGHLGAELLGKYWENQGLQIQVCTKKHTEKFKLL